MKKSTIVIILLLAVAAGVGVGVYLGGFVGGAAVEETSDVSAFSNTSIGGSGASDWHALSASSEDYFPAQLLSDKALEKVIGVGVPKYRVQSRQSRNSRAGHYYMVEAVSNFKLTKIFVNDLKKHCAKYEETDSIPTYYFLDCPVVDDEQCTSMDVTIRCQHGTNYMQVACLPKND